MMEPIRILHVVTYMGRGGLETMLMNFFRHIDRNQVQFDFLTHRDFRADYDDEIESMGGKIYRLPRLVPWNSTYRKKLNLFLKEHSEYRIIHVHQDCLSSVVLKEAKKQGIPVRIAHSHSGSQDKNMKYLIKLYYRQQIPQYATELFACGKDAGDWMFLGAPYRILNNAIDTKKYAYSPMIRMKKRAELGIGQETLLVGHVGRFDPVKNHTFLLDVFAQVKRIQSNAKLLLVGDGELRSTIEKKVESLGISDGVILTGVRSDVAELMQAMDVFVFPSLYEGLPLTLIEAQTAGLPCLISDSVSDECAKTDLVERVPLKAGTQDWAQRILKMAKIQRQDTSTVIVRAGYDLEENARWLEEYYLQQWKREM